MLHAAILPIPVPFENASRSGAGIACLFTTKTRVSTSSPRKKLVVFRISPQWSQGRTWIGQLGSSEMSEETAETARDSALSLSLTLCRLHIPVHPFQIDNFTCTVSRRWSPNASKCASVVGVTCSAGGSGGRGDVDRSSQPLRPIVGRGPPSRCTMHGTKSGVSPLGTKC